MAGTRNSRAGHAYEREIVDRLKASRFFPWVATTRLVSRLLDSLKIDICNLDMEEQGRLQYNFQTKTICGQPNYLKELAKLPIVEGIINVFLHKKTEKRGTRFFTIGNTATLSEDDFFRLITDRERYRVGFEILNEYFDSISDEEKPAVHELLKQLEL